MRAKPNHEVKGAAYSTQRQGCYKVPIWRKLQNISAADSSFYLSPSSCAPSISSALTQRRHCLGYSRAEALCKEYRQTKGPGTTAKPSEQLFFLKLGGLIKNTLEKCQRENGFMWVIQQTHTHTGVANFRPNVYAL